MDMSDIPFDVPVILHSIRKHKNLQNAVGTKEARCLEDNVYEQLVLRHVDDNTVVIQSACNNRYLQDRTNGHCVFGSIRIRDQSLFTIEANSTSSLFFMPCFTGNVLQCDNELVVKDRQRLILELAKGGKTPDEIEQIVTRLFDSPTVGVPSSAYAIQLPSTSKNLPNIIYMTYPNALS
ncbi:hypothetical protein PC116_g22862 [Phytophthora cactorum]|uniref:Uncharacterized protein n=1 Tax=Phytophthora cactorum TaxID=29920 RepID=A0A8T0YL79_9STRA|nr:hypothetical protein PC112_g18976 [Phytophthora cactorum]KAG2814656.1 hypothetical protein PC111_g13878 [Phytophthora cactorum]KAG2841988.1 hypothetical protein PC113_g18913 [Phytophthora cactorum]KAG2893838.1 hypothetical protein PC115_g18319 [Phytophthora cactorum]KAG2967411.1 hypothetical protein PC118_g18603 [Phytophthora cactorum]